ncbi:ammonia permease [Bacillus sp. TL12]|uniref:ammonia permease n=1 Tax=Bacillus sp. TL12 TaxID=2894756 RepID=UPI001F52363F|nr:ammonia permease [Bacillus sp. TL12]MCI0763952.1 ammonia permease [Bacillus sp. TL12]
MQMLSFLWIFFMPILVSCGIVGGIYLVIAGLMYRKPFVITMGLICFSFVAMPFIFWGMGIDGEKILPIPTVLYWFLFALAGLLASISGIRNQMISIRNMGMIIFTVGVLGAIFYQLMSMPDSFSIPG